MWAYLGKLAKMRKFAKLPFSKIRKKINKTAAATKITEFVQNFVGYKNPQQLLSLAQTRGCSRVNYGTPKMRKIEDFQYSKSIISDPSEFSHLKLRQLVVHTGTIDSQKLSVIHLADSEISTVEFNMGNPL